MSVRIRLRRVGRKRQPSYRIVVAESTTPRSGVYLDNVGFYNPRRDPAELRIDLARVEAWIEKGAEMTPTVASLVRRARRGEAEGPVEVTKAEESAEAATESAPEASADEGEAAEAAASE